MSVPNILLITADDMNWDSVGVYGCPVAETTPNIDRLATSGIRFEHGHVTIAVCQPSRSTIMTGRYPHRSGGQGFHRLNRANIPILPAILRSVDYQIGILGKVTHSTPYANFEWDMSYDMEELGLGRNPSLYRQHAGDFIQKAALNQRPFFLMANAHDPHRPFFGNDKIEWYQRDLPAIPPSRIFQPKEIVIPDFLPDVADVRLEIAEYYNSVRRCDDTVGQLLSVLDQYQVSEDTLVLFLSDNGMAFPFAKTNCYLNSTRSPWIARWPAKISAGQVDCNHFVSGIDILPTILDIIGLPSPDAIDGSTFYPLLSGRPETSRDHVFTQFHLTSAGRHYPMRCVQNQQFGYIFNAWSDGQRMFRNESQSGRTMMAMKSTAKIESEIADRVNFFLYRTVEELYDFAQDPNALHNLVDHPASQLQLNQLRQLLGKWMIDTQDPALYAFQNRYDSSTLSRFMETMEAESQTE